MFLAIHLLGCHPIPEGAVEHNVLLVSVDTTRADHLGVLGDDRGLTPSLDRFARDAVLYERARSVAPWTKPSIATVFTSMLPRDHGVRDWQFSVPKDLPTLAGELKASGWRTEAIVAHEAFHPDTNTFHVGFHAFDISVFDDVGTPTDLITSKPLADLALDAIDRLDDRNDPWLLWVHFFDPHSSYKDHDELLDLGDDKAARYAEEVAYTDHHIGRVLDRVEGRSDTMVVVLADHGEELADRHEDRFGHTRTLYEELVRVPLMIRRPGAAPEVVTHSVSLIDLAPTIFDHLALTPPSSWSGETLLGESSGRPSFMETSRTGNRRGVVVDDWKLVVDVETGRRELYDLRLDPLERRNLALSDPDTVDHLYEILADTYPELDGSP